MKTLIRLLAGGAIAAATPAEAQTHVLDPGVTYSTGEIFSYSTTGAGMMGMLVTPHFEGGDSLSLTWDRGREDRCGAFHGAFSLSMDCAGDTFSSPWQIFSIAAATGGPGITRIVLNGAPGKTVFDFDPDAEVTPGSALGSPFEYVGAGDRFSTLVVYRNAVSVGGVAPRGDLFETVEIIFQRPILGEYVDGRWVLDPVQFTLDTDTAPVREGPPQQMGMMGLVAATQTPEPATWALLVAGLLAVGVVAPRRARRAALLALTLASAPHAAVAQATIVIPGNGGAALSPGDVIGQTFRVPLIGADRLDRFSFWVAGGPTTLRAHLYAWDPVALRPTGSRLLASPDFAAPPFPPGAIAFARFDVLAGGLPVLAGGTYVALVGAVSATDAFGAELNAVGDAYAGGTGVNLPAAGDPARWTTEPWFIEPTDYRFEAVFSATAVPEPDSRALVAAGLLIAAAVARRWATAAARRSTT